MTGPTFVADPGAGALNAPPPSLGAWPTSGPYPGHPPLVQAPPGYAPAPPYAHAYPVFAAPHDPSRTRLWFSGQPGEFVRLLVRGALLSLVTFGFYRFWLITDMRRHLWANTRIGEEGLEYTGTARELLVGFLVALAVLAPLYVGYFIVVTFAETFAMFAGFALTPLLYVFGQYAGYRARRYRATRTLFRGVRFWMGGSAWAYAARAALWDLATLLSLGLAYPWRVAALERYKMRNTHFGDLGGDFVARGGTFFRRGWWMWLLTVALPVVLFVIVALVSARGGEQDAAASLGAGLGAALVLTFGLGPFLFPLFLATRIRWQIEGVRFGPVGIANNLPRGEVFLAYLKLVAASAGLSMAFGLVVAAVAGALAVSGVKLDEAFGDMGPRVILGLGLTALSYLAFLQGTGVLKRYFIDRGLWLLVAFTSSADHLDATDHVRGGAAPASSVGEGLADALDVGAF